MQEIKIYKNYGVLGAEKRNVYTYGGEHVRATSSDEMTVLVPEEWEVYVCHTGQLAVKSPWGWNYGINDVLTDVNGHPAFRVLDKNGRPHTTYLYTAEELEEKRKKEEKKRERQHKAERELKEKTNGQ